MTVPATPRRDDGPLAVYRCLFPGCPHQQWYPSDFDLSTDLARFIDREMRAHLDDRHAGWSLKALRILRDLRNHGKDHLGRRDPQAEARIAAVLARGRLGDWTPPPNRPEPPPAHTHRGSRMQVDDGLWWWVCEVDGCEKTAMEIDVTVADPLFAEAVGAPAEVTALSRRKIIT